MNNHTFRKDQQHHQRQQPSISLSEILVSLSQDSLPFCLSLSFHFHYLEKYLFPTASGNNTTVSASSWLWKQSLVTNCCVLHRDSLTENLPTNRHFISAVIWCVTAAIPLLSCPQHSPFHWIAFCISIPSSEILFG